MTCSAFMLACLALAGVSGQTESSRSFSEHFVEANGIRLHYLDWGGQGEPVVFLTGFGTPAATFNGLAVGIRDRFHGLEITQIAWAPPLSISAVKERHPGIPPDATIEIRERADAYWRAVAVPTQERWLATFRRDVPHAKVITYRDASHYFYLDRGADVLAEIKRFCSTLR